MTQFSGLIKNKQTKKQREQGGEQRQGFSGKTD